MGHQVLSTSQAGAQPGVGGRERDPWPEAAPAAHPRAHQDVERALRALLVLFDGGEHGQHQAREDQQEPGTGEARSAAEAGGGAAEQTPHTLPTPPSVLVGPDSLGLPGHPGLRVKGNRPGLLGWRQDCHLPRSGEGWAHQPHACCFLLTSPSLGSKAETFCLPVNADLHMQPPRSPCLGPCVLGSCPVRHGVHRLGVPSTDLCLWLPCRSLTIRHQEPLRRQRGG